ncbi:SRPBCC family protein [Paenibacillus sp. 481]|uniref:SRPBCC family protein n=1 Tax=Paenibacillus sp. 481 TaxID=2835869 RepID=UPI001E519D4A|nr:SRPBCC domain-containing protein [Paenibacillus sp. 481]UHA75481.1 SRPBCC domain-containing protein [Paenibacillus sp. 481]
MEQNTPETLQEIRQTIVLNASIQKVWDAVATSEGIAVWFMPNDFKPIEGYEFHLNAGQFGMSPCKVTEIEPPNRLSFDWAQDWKITFQLVDLGEGQTEFTLIHAGWDANKVTEFGQPHTVVRERMGQGWVGIVKALSAYVEA